MTELEKCMAGEWYDCHDKVFLELNICCHLGKSGSICLAAAEHGYSQADLLKYIIAYSMHRQKNLRQYGTWLI